MSGSKNPILVPRAKNALDQLKNEVAKEVGVPLSQGYNGDISARDAGRIGGNMVRRMIMDAQKGYENNQ